jgi:hypothetical protein
VASSWQQHAPPRGALLGIHACSAWNSLQRVWRPNHKGICHSKMLSRRRGQLENPSTGFFVPLSRGRGSVMVEGGVEVHGPDLPCPSVLTASARSSLLHLHHQSW